MSAVLFAHERPSVARAVSHVLAARGFEVEAVRDGHAAADAMQRRAYDALVVDVALPGRPGYELIEVARSAAANGGQGAKVVVLVASVFRKTSYKRRPARLYGADDYVELHHLGDMLPDKLARLLELEAPRDDAAEQETTDAVTEVADARFDDNDPARLAALIIADVVLYNGDRLADARTVAQARAALHDDLEVAQDLLRQVYVARGIDTPQQAHAAIERAFSTLLRSMGRTEEAS